jgi:hypothetical protein
VALPKIFDFGSGRPTGGVVAAWVPSIVPRYSTNGESGRIWTR